MSRKNSLYVAKTVFDVPIGTEEADRLAEFKNLTRDLPIPDETDDYFYLKWLRARDLNLFKARTMLEAYLEWRRGRKPSLIDWNPSQLITDEAVLAITGTDNDGRPVACGLGGAVNYKLIFETGLKSELTQFMYKFLEKLRLAEAQARKANGGVTQVVLVIDLEGMTFLKVTQPELIQFSITFSKVVEAYYPELLHRCYLINVGWAFSLLFNMMKPFLSPLTIKKIQLFPKESKDSDKWKTTLFQNIPTKSLPEEFGGTAGSIFDFI